MEVAPASPSPLAAPNTPIASAKRLRHKVPRSEPRSTAKLASPELKPIARQLDIDDAEDSATRKLSFKSKRPLEPNTPSKNLFSPCLRSDSADGPHHSGDKGHSADSDYDVSSDSMNSPTEEIKQTSMIAEEDEDEAMDEEEDDRINHHHEHYQDEADEDDEVYEDDINAFNPYLFISELPPHEHVVETGKLCLPPKAPSDVRLKTLVLDLDESLVHCSVVPMPDPDLIFPVLFNGTLHQVYVRKRPYLDHFLETVSKLFEVVLFTASQKVYADMLLNRLDPKGQHIKYRLFREACLVVQGNYLKDLTVLGRDLSQTMLVDNSPYAYAYQTSNGIPIESWYDDHHDTELLKLIGFLRRIQNAEDVRPLIRNHFKTHELISRARAGKFVPLSAPPF